MSNDKPETVNQYTQTVIHCYPHLLDSENQIATVVSNRGCQTIASVDPARTNDDLYTKLEYTPYQSIAEGAVKELDLPRKALLQWRLTDSNVTVRTRCDSDTPRSALKRSVSSTRRLSAFQHTSSRNISKSGKETADKEVQTALTVLPHVLNVDEIANVYTEMSIQTSISCMPSESTSNIIPRLQGNLTHSTEGSSTATQVNHTSDGFLTDDLGEASVAKVISTSELAQEQPLAPSPRPRRQPQDSEEKLISIVDLTQEQRPNPIPQPRPKLVQRQDVVSVTTQASCSCGRRLLQEMASQLRVDTATVQLTPVVFPPETPFGDRMVQVLNTSIALLQTEIANMMQAYIEEQNPSCPCTGNHDNDAMLSKVCMCSGTSQNACTCSRIKNACKQPSVCPGAQKKVSKISRTREVVSPRSSITGRIVENIVEETTRTVARRNNDEIVEEQVVTTIQQEPPQLPRTTSRPIGSVCSLIETLSRLTETGDVSEAYGMEELLSDSSMEHMQYLACERLSTDYGTLSSPYSTTDKEPPPLLLEYPGRMLYKSDSVSASTTSTNTVKFEFLLQGQNQDESISGNTAAVAGANIFTHTASDAPVKTGCSLPDLREQVIRLSVMFKGRPSHEEPLLEKVLPHGDRVIFAPRNASSKKSVCCKQCPSPVTLSEAAACANQTTSTSSMPCSGQAGVHSGTPSTSTHASANVHLIIRYPMPPGEGTDTADDEADTRPFHLMYETEANYEEPYMDALLEGDRDETEELKEKPVPVEENKQEIPVVDEDMKAASRTILPWEALVIPEPGSYCIETLPSNTRQRWTQKDPVMVVGQAVEVDEPILSETGEVETMGYGEEDWEETDWESEADVLEEKPSRRKQSLLYQKSAFKRNEPYMESLYRQFPDSEDDDEACGSKTEIPWKDILLPEKCRIRKMNKAQKCICKKGMFTSSDTAEGEPTTSDEEDTSWIAVHVGVEERLSTMWPVEDGPAAECRSVTSTISDFSKMPKRASKNYSISRLNTYTVGPALSEPFSVTVASSQGDSFSTALSSTTLRFNPGLTDVYPVAGAMPGPPQAEVSPRGNSCPVMEATEAAVTVPARGTVSMPLMGGADATIKATIRLKQSDVIITKQMDLKPGENVINLTMDDQPINLHLRLTTPGAASSIEPNQIVPIVPMPPLTPPAPAVAAKVPESEGEQVPERGASASPANASPTPGDRFVPFRCPCRDKGIVDPIKQDPVIAALEAYEAEMKPLKRTLAELQNKIRSLNMPELKGCVCSTVVHNAEQAAAAVAESSLTGCGRCPYYQKGKFQPLPEPPYGRLPAPVLPPRIRNYDYSSTKGCYRGANAPVAKPNYSAYYNTFYPQEDMASKVVQCGIYPDYRSRNYPNRRAAYECCKQPKSATGTREKAWVRTVVSAHSSGNVNSDSSRCSEEESRSSSHRRRKDKADRQPKSRCPCQEATPIRDGQALRTNVDDFLPKIQNAGGCCTPKRKSSRTKDTVRVRSSRGTSNTRCSGC